ncbi:granzyme B(G,H)-like [Otolemur garnettii]|uniref:granzyme B(G,H)-like n=1 Tax=Otolemur garnettii TaxID=30611 RepID=UPI0002742799|nr:granzyme B(G,H)-like [Otolemur garnettii]
MQPLLLPLLLAFFLIPRAETAPLCSLCSSMNVTLGAHNIERPEETQQVIHVRRAIPHPDYIPHPFYTNDIMLLQLDRKAKRTTAVRPIGLPRISGGVMPGMVCSVAGWGWTTPVGHYPDTLQEVMLTVQNDWKCESRYPQAYIKATQICVGDPNLQQASFYVRLCSCYFALGEGKFGKDQESGDPSGRELLHPLGCDLSLGREEGSTPS